MRQARPGIRSSVNSQGLSEPEPPRPYLGFGLGLRAPHYAHILEHRPKIDWFEALTENFLGITDRPFGRPVHFLEKVRENYPIVFHGVSLSIGSVDPLDFGYLEKLKTLAESMQPQWISDHLCWTGVQGENLHDLLPLPFTEETLRHLTERVDAVQNFLKRPFALENVSSYLTYRHSEMTEWEFLAELTRRSGCFLLLDINNIYVSSVNHGFNPRQFLEGIPVDRPIQFHLAGYSDNGDHLIDTHDHPVSEPVWNLYQEAVKRFGPVSTNIEWDDHIPDFPRLEEELRKAEAL